MIKKRLHFFQSIWIGGETRPPLQSELQVTATATVGDALLSIGRDVGSFWRAAPRLRRLQEQARGSGWGRGRQPVINVTWNAATKEYLPWLSRITGKTYRLLTEAESGYAARGVTAAAAMSTNYSWGNDIGTNLANCYSCGSRWDNQQAAAVGSFQPDGFGLHDMHGNVWEWVQDCYKDTYASAPSDGRAPPDVPSCFRGMRGGSWPNSPQVLPAPPTATRALPTVVGTASASALPDATP